MVDVLTYDPAAALKLIDGPGLAGLTDKLNAARREVAVDIEQFVSGKVPEAKVPLDAGFIDWPAKLLADKSSSGVLAKIEATADRLRNDIDILVSLGIGGSYMGLRALFEALCHPLHNMLKREERNGSPRLFFEGDNLDERSMGALLGLLKKCGERKDVFGNWGIIVISKSGGTLETAAAFRVFRELLEQQQGAGSEAVRKLIVPVTGTEGKLRSISEKEQYQDVFDIPEGIGGRFSIFTPVALLPAAVLGIDIRALLQGAADITSRFRTAPVGSNPVLDYVGVCHLCEQRGMTTRILSTWGKPLEACGLWYDQLLSESLGKQEQGALPLTVVNTRDLHSRGQQHQEGRRDKLITNVIVRPSASGSITLPKVDGSRNQDGLNDYAGFRISQLLDCAIEGTNRAYANDRRPTADIHLPALNAYHIGEFLQMMMLATVVEGRLIGINPYGQPGVEGYKGEMKRALENLKRS
jgi:glucose-6-phosphate isomerase